MEVLLITVIIISFLPPIFIWSRFWLDNYSTQQREQLNSIRQYSEICEQIVGIIVNPSDYTVETVSEVLDEFNNKSLFLPSEMTVLWLKFNLRERILCTQTHPDELTDSDLQIFSKFIVAIRRAFRGSASFREYKLIYQILEEAYGES